jgi:PAS domain S-box-containing protein
VAIDPHDPELVQLRRTNQMLQQRVKQAERIRKQWSEMVVKLQQSHDREKLISQQLAEKEAFLSSITASMDEGVYALNREGELTFMNPKAEQLLGWRQEELLGENVHDIIHSHSSDHSGGESSECLILQTIAKGESYAVDKDWFQAKDETVFPVALFSSPLIERGQCSGAVAVFRDIRKELETKQRLVESEKMASLGGMVAGVAHEVNTPIGIGVTGITHLTEETRQFQRAFEAGELTKQGLSSYLSTVSESAEIVFSNLRRAADLISDFKKVAVNQSLAECEPFLLKRHIEQLLLTLKPRLAEQEVEISVICPEQLQIESDAGALSQILTNLVENSLIHAYPAGESGAFLIRLQYIGHPGDLADEIELSYWDDGRGMPEESRLHIFEPFFTTRRNEGGSGLGMQIVYNLVVHRLQGAINVWSEPGEGTHFTIHFPLGACPEE